MSSHNTVTRLPRGLYGLTPDWRDFNRLSAAVIDADQGGMQVLQWRRKDLDAREQRIQARAMAELCRARGIIFIINDDWHLRST